jgi:hypothetical protein
MQFAALHRAKPRCLRNRIYSTVGAIRNREQTTLPDSDPQANDGLCMDPSWSAGALPRAEGFSEGRPPAHTIRRVPVF